MPRPRWVAPPETEGFDGKATPPWLIVGLPGAPLLGRPLPSFRKRMLLVDGQNLVVKPVNENIAEIQESTVPSAREREFIISGKNPATTFIDVRLARLEVVVARDISLKIAFQFVKDEYFKRPEWNQNLLPRLELGLDQAFAGRANLRFQKTRTLDVEVDTSLRKLVNELDENKRQRVGKRAHWDKLTQKGDPTADINVFFMPLETSKDKRLLGIIGQEGSYICHDGMTLYDILKALPHMIGQFLLCPIVYDSDKSQLLMHADRNEDPSAVADVVGTIPKSCALVMRANAAS